MTLIVRQRGLLLFLILNGQQTRFSQVYKPSSIVREIVEKEQFFYGLRQLELIQLVKLQFCVAAGNSFKAIYQPESNKPFMDWLRCLNLLILPKHKNNGSLKDF